MKKKSILAVVALLSLVGLATAEEATIDTELNLEQPTIAFTEKYIADEGLHSLRIDFKGWLQVSFDLKEWYTIADDDSKPVEIPVSADQIFFRSVPNYEKIFELDSELNLLLSAKKNDQNPTTDDTAIPAIQLIKCPQGYFMMGSPSGEFGRGPNEDQKMVNITKDFFIGKFEITQEQYQMIMGTNPSSNIGYNKPVETVSYGDALDFCSKMNARRSEIKNMPPGYRFALPTTAQWEYACRAETVTSLNNGRNLTSLWAPCELDDTGWYQGNANYTTHEVGQLRGNRWGIFDMHGNVNEWCQDTSGAYAYYRGGSYQKSPEYCRSATNLSDYGQNRYIDVGFRIVLVPDNYSEQIIPIR